MDGTTGFFLTSKKNMSKLIYEFDMLGSSPNFQNLQYIFFQFKFTYICVFG